MSRAQSRNAVSLILAFGLMWSVFPTARGDDGKGPAETKPEMPPSPAAAKPAPPAAAKPAAPAAAKPAPPRPRSPRPQR